jgi:hypothetical protein
MTITLHKNGIKVVNSTTAERKEISDNYGNGLNWKKINSDTFVLFGLFGLAQMAVEKYTNK